jgi:hypothetical protein
VRIIREESESGIRRVTLSLSERERERERERESERGRMSGKVRTGSKDKKSMYLLDEGGNSGADVSYLFLVDGDKVRDYAPS